MELCTRTTEHKSAAALHTQERPALQMLRSHYMTAAARGSNESFDAYIENSMHEGKDIDIPDDTIADAPDCQTVEEKQWAQQDVEGRLLDEQTTVQMMFCSSISFQRARDCSSKLAGGQRSGSCSKTMLQLIRRRMHQRQ